jgi:hypothetical protein
MNLKLFQDSDKEWILSRVSKNSVNLSVFSEVLRVSNCITELHGVIMEFNRDKNLAFKGFWMPFY